MKSGLWNLIGRLVGREESRPRAAERCLIITLAHVKDANSFRFPRNSHGVDIRLSDTSLTLESSAFIDRYVHPGITQLLTEEEIRVTTEVSELA